MSNMMPDNTIPYGIEGLSLHDERAKLIFSHDRTSRELLTYTGALPTDRDGRPLRTVLLEFKSDHDRGTARQTALYLFDLWEDGQKLAALRTGADSVPTRAALVYTGRTKWTTDLSLPNVGLDGDDEAAAAAEGFLSGWQDSRLPTYNELDALVTLQRDGQDPRVWWAEQIRSGQTQNSANGGALNDNID